MNSNPQHIANLQAAIEPLRQRIIQHPAYGAITQVAHLRLFMEYHVFAVWDFMSLLKSLQRQLTCTTVPWFPVGNADTRFLINEIVVGEESDVDEKGVRKSHFELYLDAMQQCGAHTGRIQDFIVQLQLHGNLHQALDQSAVPQEAGAFVTHTMGVVQHAPVHVQAAVFTFGREDLIPGMFHSIVTDISTRLPDSLSTFMYYLERHIEVDGGHHSHLALQMTEQLCGTNPQKWAEAEAAVAESLRMRLQLWDGIYKAINSGQAALTAAA